MKSPKEYPFYGRLWIHLMYHYQKCISYIESSKNLASKSLKARAMKVALCSLFFVNSPREKFFTVFKCPSKRNFYIFCCNNINTKKAQFFAWLRQKILYITWKIDIPNSFFWILHNQRWLSFSEWYLTRAQSGQN